MWVTEKEKKIILLNNNIKSFLRNVNEVIHKTQGWDGGWAPQRTNVRSVKRSYLLTYKSMPLYVKVSDISRCEKGLFFQLHRLYVHVPK